MIKGIDVSSVQGNIDWPAVAASGVQFAIIKNYQGNDGQDTLFHKNIVGAEAAGLKTAVYNFVYPLRSDPAHPNRDAVGQANLHYNSSEGKIMCVDVEWPAPVDFNKWKIDGAFINQWTIDYLAELSKLSAPRSPIVYTYPDFAHHVGFTQELAQYPLWCASYAPTPQIPSPWIDWLIWQNTGGGGSLPNGAPVDTNLVRDLSLWDV